MTLDSTTESPVSAGGDLRGIARGGLVNLAGSAVTGLAAFGATLLVTHVLTRTQAGQFFAATSLFLVVVTMGQLGTSTGLVYFVARERALGRPDAARHLVRVAAGPVVAVGVCAALVGLVAAPHLGALITGHGDGTDATTYVRLLSVFVPFAGIEVVLLAALRGFGSMRANAIVELVGRPLLQLLMLGIALAVGGASAIALAWGLPYALAATAAWLWWQRHGRDVPASTTRLLPTRLDFWRFTGPRAFTSVLQTVMQRFDIVLVGVLAGAVPAAVYAAVTRFVVIGQMGVVAFTMSAQPRLSHTLARGDVEASSAIYRLSAAWLILLTWPLYLSLVVFRGLLVGVFGRGYAAGSPVLAWLSLSMLVATGCGLVDVVLSMAGRTSWNLANAVGALVCNLVLDVLLIPGHGVLGAAIGWAVAIAVRNLAAVIQVGLALRLHPLGRCTVLAGAMTVLAFGVLGEATRAVVGDSWTGLGCALVTGALVLSLGVWGGRRTLRLDVWLPGFGNATAPASDL